MSHYRIRFHTRPQLCFASLLQGASTLAEGLVPMLDGVGDIDYQPAAVGGEILELTLIRPNRDRVFNEIAAAVQQLGYSMVEAEISDIVDRTVEWAVRGFLSAGALGSTTKKPYVALLAAAAGGAAGAKAGSLVQTVAAKHQYQWFPAVGWVVTELAIEAPAEQVDPVQVQGTAAILPA
jgi:hypothetical protein